MRVWSLADLLGGDNFIQLPTMSATIEKRISDLERQVAILTQRATGASSSKEKDWRSTIGMLPQDELSEEADRLGREWREEHLEP